jgi:hypothetical protein
MTVFMGQIIPPPTPPPEGTTEFVGPPGRGHIMLTPDLFAEKAQKVALARTSSEKSNDKHAIRTRRPYTGIRIKENTPSVLSIYRQDSDEAIPLVSSGGNWTPETDKVLGGGPLPEGEEVDLTAFTQNYSDFIIQSVEEQRAEKQQIVDTFGDTYIFFYGEQPRIVNFSGQLINTADFNWRSQFWHNYDKFLRGTKLVEQNARAYISFDTIVVEGYPLSVNAVDNSEAPYQVQFQMQMFVTGYYDFSPIGLPYYYQGKEEKVRPADWDHYNAAGADSVPVTQSEFAQDAAQLQAFLHEQNTKWNLDAFSPIRSEISNARYALYQKLAELRRSDMVAGLGHLMNQSLGLIDDLKQLYQAANQVTGTFATYGIPMMANSAAFAADPIGMIKYSLGLSSPGSFAYEFAINRALDAFSNKMDMATNILEGLGTPATVEAAAIRSVGPFVRTEDAAIGTVRRSSASSDSGASSTPTAGNLQDGGYLGHSGGRAGRTFSSIFKDTKARLEAGDTVSVGVGDSFRVHPYATTPSAEVNYETVYGDRDYGQVIESDPTILQTLKESYGDVNPSSAEDPQGYEEDTDVFSQVAEEFELSNVGTDVDPAAIEEVYRTGVSSRYVLTSNQVHYILDLVNQKTGTFSDEDTTGIRGVDDDDAPIDPVA